MENFFYFGSKYLSNSLCVESFGLGEREKSMSNHENLITAQYGKIQFPVVFKQITGKVLSDILTTGVPSLFLISDRLKKILILNNFTGWDFFSIDLKDKKENQIEGYYGFSVTGISGPISYENSPIVESRYIPGGPIVKEYKGAEIGLDKWDKSNFFIPENTTEIIVTRKTAEILKENKITNLKLTNVAEAQYPIFLFNR